MAEVRRGLIVDFQNARAYALALECRRPKAGSGFIREAPRTHVLGYVCVALRARGRRVGRG